MNRLVEVWAQQIGWPIRQRNVIVEGMIDVTLLRHAQRLYFADRGVDIFGGSFAILAAGRGNEGGVDGVNRRLSAARQLAEVDLTREGTRRFSFIGLFDNDEAGRRAFMHANRFDRRVVLYQDVFLLHPVMPPADGASGSEVQARAGTLNSSFGGLDWEIEDLISEKLLWSFEDNHPEAVVRKTERGGLTHWDFTRAGKRELVRFVKRNAVLSDLMEIVRLVCALRDYLGLGNELVSAACSVGLHPAAGSMKNCIE